MQLPEYLKSAIFKLISTIHSDELTHFATQLSDRYRENQNSHEPFMRQQGDYLAYLTTRFPATFGAIWRVLEETRKCLPEDISIKSLLDVGAGPGTAFFAANEVFPIEKACLIEKEAGLIAIGQTLTDARCEWIQTDLEGMLSFKKHDLVTISYALGELTEAHRESLLKSLWTATEKIIVIIEPGTPGGFQRILAARKWLQSLGGVIVAPCTHQNSCPLQDNDWCHFPQRIERSREHRLSKNAALNFEDEKFSYIVFSKEPILLQNQARVLYSPAKHSGHVELSLCDEQGIETRVISRKSKTLYRIAKKAKWGDAL